MDPFATELLLLLLLLVFIFGFMTSCSYFLSTFSSNHFTPGLFLPLFLEFPFVNSFLVFPFPSFYSLAMSTSVIIIIIIIIIINNNNNNYKVYLGRNHAFFNFYVCYFCMIVSFLLTHVLNAWD